MDLLDVRAQVGVDVMGRMRQLASVPALMRTPGQQLRGASLMSETALPRLRHCQPSLIRHGRVRPQQMLPGLPGSVSRQVSRVFTDAASASCKDVCKGQRWPPPGFGLPPEQAGSAPRLPASLIWLGWWLALSGQLFLSRSARKTVQGSATAGLPCADVHGYSRPLNNIDGVVEEHRNIRLIAIVTASVALVIRAGGQMPV